MLIDWSRPSTRCAVTPGRRAIDSAIELSGSLPMSSDDTLSRIWSAVRLVLIALVMEARKPVTTMSDPCVAGVASVCAAWPPTSDVGSSVLPPGVLVACGFAVEGALVLGPVVCASVWVELLDGSACWAAAGAAKIRATLNAPMLTAP